MAHVEVGSELAGCRIEAVAGRGGMGIVYRARQVTLDRRVAVKVVAPELVADDSFRERFMRESRLTAALEHPNVVPVYETGERDGILYLVTRWVPGTDLRTLLRNEGSLSPARAVGLLLPVAGALAAGHRRGLIHRDVKPTNILIANEDGEEHPYLIDFGLARSTDAMSDLTKTGFWIGTLDYMAPELYRGERGDARSDVYAFGCTLFQVLTGQVPFPRENEVARMHAHCSDAPPPLAGVPAELATVVTRAMAKDPADRYGDGRELAAALQAVASASATSPVPQPLPTVETPRTVETPPPTEITPRAPAATVETPSPSAPTEATRPRAEVTQRLRGDARPRRPGGRRLALALASLVGLAIIVAVAVMLASGDGGSPKAAVKALPPITGLPDGPDGIAFGDGSVWVTSSEAAKVTRIDAGSREVTATIDVGRDPDSVAVTPSAVWVTNTADDSVTRIDPSNDEPRPAIAVASRPEGIAVDGDAVFVAGSARGQITRIDAATGETITRRVADGAAGIAVGDGFVWMADPRGGAVVRCRPDLTDVRRIALSGEPRAVAFGEGGLWVASNDGTVARIDPKAAQVAESFDAGDELRGIAVGDGSVWLTSGANVARRLDPATGDVTDEVSVGRAPYGVTIGAGKAWTADLKSNSVTPIELGS